MSLENLSIEARDELAALAQQLADNPETRKEFLKMTKKVKPEIPIPELDIEEKTTMAVNRAEQRVQELEAKLKQKDALEELHRRRQAIVKKGLASEDDIEGIEKLMLEKKIADHETAAQYHEWMKQAAEPTPSGYNPNVMRKWNLDSYRVNPVTAARDEAVKALAELRKPTRPIGL
jgi:hypothetical protein